MIYGSEIVTHRYYDGSYYKDVREALCSECGELIGEQVRYTHIDADFRFRDEKELYKYCPYCGHKFKK